MMSKSLFMPMLSWLDCIRWPLHVARAVRLYAADRHREQQEHEVQVAKLERELATLGSENMSLRAAASVRAFHVVRGGKGLQ